MASSEGEFDYIIVGGGTAGLVVANRLSEDENLRILIIEAGANHNSDPKIAVPGYLQQVFGDAEYDWSFNTLPQISLNGRVVNQIRGKVLGGSSAINAMVTIYPSKRIFDIWTELGNNGWDRDTMTPYFKKFQTFHQPGPELAKELSMGYMDHELYGKEGPIQTSFSNFHLPLTKLFGETLTNLGYKAIKDPISGEAVGAFTAPNYVDPKSATRSHAGVAYYEPISSRPNLHLKERALVDKVLLSKSSDGSILATGVQYTINGESHISYAKREVILSAGAFGSPTILELSGVGNPVLLNSLGIDVIISNSNVGENLQDHPMSLVTAEVVNENDSLDSLRDPKKLQEAIRQYTELKTGPLAAGFNSMAGLPVAELFGPEDKKALQSLIHEHVDNQLQGLSEGQKIQVNHLKSIIMDPRESTCIFCAAPVEIFPILAPEGINSITLVPGLTHPFSRGSCHIQSANPRAHPKIDPRYLSHPLDLEVFARHILYCSTVVATKPLASMLKEDGKTNSPTGPLRTLEEAKAWAKQTSGTQFHPCGTCSMMPQHFGGVVSDRLVVHGTKNLRVVDASIFPMIPKGPITSSVYAVAERAADLIKEDLEI